MMTNQAQFEQTLDLLRQLYGTLASLRAELGPISEWEFALQAEGPLATIAELRADIEEYAGYEIIRQQRADLWIRLPNHDIHDLDLASHTFAGIMTDVRHGLNTVVRALTGGRWRGPLPKAVKARTDLRLVALTPGSVQIGLRLPYVSEETLLQDLPLDRELAPSALRAYLGVASWVASGADAMQRRDLLPNDEAWDHVLKVIRPLIPDAGSEVSAIEFRSKHSPCGEPIQLRAAHARRVESAVPAATPSAEQNHVGIIRELDLDKCRFTLRNAVVDSRLVCTFAAGYTPDVKAAFDKRVRIAVRPCRGDAARRSNEWQLVSIVLDPA